MSDLKDKLIVALDVNTLNEAQKFIDILYPKVNFFKVGIQLFTACGPEAVKMIGEKGAKVFLDLKFHDIPNTVFLSAGTGTALSYEIGSAKSTGSIESIRDVISLPVFMMTVHTKGGLEMLKAAVKGAADKAAELRISRPFIVGVTRLTSDGEDEGSLDAVLQAARIAKNAGLDGAVCSVREAAMMRKEFGQDFLIVTPGIRPKGYPADDQKRTATASEALDAGADYIVIGRPILQARDPLRTVEELI